MPEQYREPRGPYAFTLLAAFEQRRVIRVRCGNCNIRGVFDPGDLKQHVGDVGAEGVRNWMRCEKCRSQEWLSVEFWISNRPGIGGADRPAPGRRNDDPQRDLAQWAGEIG